MFYKRLIALVLLKYIYDNTQSTLLYATLHCTSTPLVDKPLSGQVLRLFTVLFHRKGLGLFLCRGMHTQVVLSHIGADERAVFAAVLPRPHVAVLRTRDPFTRSRLVSSASHSRVPNEL